MGVTRSSLGPGCALRQLRHPAGVAERTLRERLLHYSGLRISVARGRQAPVEDGELRRRVERSATRVVSRGLFVRRT
jgi:hypothetical protein